MHHQVYSRTELCVEIYWRLPQTELKISIAAQQQQLFIDVYGVRLDICA